MLINQVTTKVGSTGGYLAPALGDSWAHACTSRVMLFWEEGSRFARLYKSPSRKCDTVPYDIQAEGVSLPVSQPVIATSDWFLVHLFHPEAHVLEDHFRV